MAAWTAASLRLVSTEVASRWPGIAPGAAHLVGRSAAELSRCSAELGLPVLPLPDETGRLAEAMAGVMVADSRRGQVIGLVGGSGGLGVSTLAVSLALAAAADGRRAAAVELAPHGGGLDLIVGGETEAGLRWGDLRGARGELGDVMDRLPVVEGARVLSLTREEPGIVGASAVSAVVGSLARSADAVVVDVGSEAPPEDCDTVLLMVGGDVRSVAGARMLAEELRLTPAGIVLRSGAGRSLPTDVVARSLGAPCIGTIGDHRSLPRLGELGLPPTGQPARRYRRQVAAIWRAVAHG